MILLCTDFGVAGPYIGQMKAVLAHAAPAVPIIDLFTDLPAFEPQLAAYLLSAYVDEFSPESVFLCVVDPGVGTARRPVMLRADGRWFIGPDNGLLEVIAKRAAVAEVREITWRPEKLSASFHGRDLFAPVAAQLANGEAPPGRRIDRLTPQDDWPDELARIVYIDHFGNAMTGVRALSVESGAVIAVNGHQLRQARTFGDVPAGTAFWYENANGLLELSVNRGHAAQQLDIATGTDFAIQYIA